MRGDRLKRKECNTCGRALPLRCFGECPLSRDGYFHKCKACAYGVTVVYDEALAAVRPCPYCLLGKPDTAYPEVTEENHGMDYRCKECAEVAELDQYYKIRARAGRKKCRQTHYSKQQNRNHLWGMYLKSRGKAMPGGVFDNAKSWSILTRTHPEYKEIENMKAGNKRTDRFIALAVTLFH